MPPPRKCPRFGIFPLSAVQLLGTHLSPRVHFHGYSLLIAIAIPTFTASLNKAKVATDEANIRAGYASAMAELIAGETDVADGATLYLQKDGSVAATGTNNYTCQGKPGAAVEIAGQSVAAWDKGHKVVYTFDAAANHFAISTAAE